MLMNLQYENRNRKSTNWKNLKYPKRPFALKWLMMTPQIKITHFQTSRDISTGEHNGANAAENF